MEKDAARPGYLCGFGFWGAATWKRPAYDVWSQDSAWGKRAQLDQGQYGLSTLGSCEDVKRLSYDVVKEQRVLKLRPSCESLFRRHEETVKEHGALRPG